jgi:hypothetical protein
VKKPRKPSSTESPLFLSIDPEPIPETLTAMGGVPLLVRAFRGLGLPASVREQVEVKQRERGLPKCLHFSSPDKIIELVKRGGGFPDQESRLMLDQEWRGPGADQVSAGALVDPDDRALPRLRAGDRHRRQ